MVVGDDKLRLNSEPVPADAMPLAIGDHAARVAAAMVMAAQCGVCAAVGGSSIFPLHSGASGGASGQLAEFGAIRRTHAPEDWRGQRCDRCRAVGFQRMVNCCRRYRVLGWFQTVAISRGARDSAAKALEQAGITTCRIDPKCSPPTHSLGEFYRQPALLGWHAAAIGPFAARCRAASRHGAVTQPVMLCSPPDTAGSAAVRDDTLSVDGAASALTGEVKV